MVKNNLWENMVREELTLVLGHLRFVVCSRFDQKTADTVKRFMSDVVDDSNNFVMSWDDAYDLITKHCEGSLEILGEFEMEYWQICKKSYHGINFGVDPVDYGMTQSQMERKNFDANLQQALA
jgi:hypothetical protein